MMQRCKVDWTPNNHQSQRRILLKFQTVTSNQNHKKKQKVLPMFLNLKASLIVLQKSSNELLLLLLKAFRVPEETKIEALRSGWQKFCSWLLATFERLIKYMEKSETYTE